MICKYCKKEIENDSVFCRFCGERVQRKRKPKETVSVAPPALTRSGKYRGRVMVDGTRVWITEDTEAAYYIRARAVKAGMIEQAKNVPKDTLGKLIDRFINDNEAVLSPSTVQSYKSMRTSRFVDFMDKPVSSIPWQVMISQETVTKKTSRVKNKPPAKDKLPAKDKPPAKESKENISSKTIKNAWRLVTAALKYAKLPVPVVNLPKVVRSEREFLDYEQIQKLLPAIHGDPCEVVFLLALHSLRLSEIRALQSCDGKTILVRGATVRGKNGLTFKELNKTDLSRRDVPVMIPRLCNLLDTLPVKMSDSMINKHLRQVCVSCGLPDVTLHCLRHSFASLAYHLRWTEKSTMQIGGWSTPDVVHEIYTHLASQDVNDDITRMREFYESDVTLSKTVSKNAR